MEARHFDFAGISMRPMTTYDVEDGLVPMTFDILVNETDAEGELVGDECCLKVGSIEITRLSNYVLNKSRRDKEWAIDITAATYEWGVFTRDEMGPFWDKAYPEACGGMLESIETFIGIESVFIEPQFRGKGLMGQALKLMAMSIGFEYGCMMVLMANPWHTQDRETDYVNDPEYRKDMAKLVAAYQKIGFRELGWHGYVVLMCLSSDVKNAKWDRLWTKNTVKPMKLKKLNAMTLSR